MASTLDEAFALERTGGMRFRAPTVPTDERRVFGGLTLGQALAAAALTVEGAHCNSLHALFGAAAAPDRPLELSVEKLRDGRSFIARRVEARQGDRLILTGLASFHNGDEGPEHSIAMPVLPPPDDLPSLREALAANAAKHGMPPRRFASDTMLDVRPVDRQPDTSNGVEGRRALWFRPRVPFVDTAWARRAVVAFASDMGLVHVGLQPNRVMGGGGPLEDASLDHAIWFHRDPPAAGWLLHVQRAPVAAHGRGLSHGQIFTPGGELVASTAQEILLRRRRA